MGVLQAVEFNIDRIKENLQCFNRPIYETVIVTLTEMIKSGELPAGTKFPPDKKLAIELGISHITLAKALNELRRRNILDRRRATGTVVPENIQLPTANAARRKIAVVFDNVSDETFQQPLFIALYRGLEELNCSLCFFSCGSDPEKQLATCEEILNDFSISGCILWSILDNEQAAKLIRRCPNYYPLIFMDKHYEGFDHDAVTYPNYDCGAAIARSFNRRKITRCCWIEEKFKHDLPSDKERREGFLSVWKDNDFQLLFLPETPEEKENFRIPDGCAVVCCDQVVAVALKKIFAENPAIVPQKLFVIESPSDDHSLVPEFTAFKFASGIGAETIKILASRLNGKECCTVSHSGKWSVLEAKSQKRRKTNVKKNL